MATKATGFRVRAIEGTTKIIHEQTFLFKDSETAEEQARTHHKHIAKTHPGATVTTDYVFETETSQDSARL